jgi:hypothetical protein
MTAGRRDETAYRVSIFLPAYNEIDNLEGAVADIGRAAPQVLGDHEILIIDDGSTEHVSFLPADGEIARESIRDILAAVGRADIVAPYHQNPRARQIHRRILTWASTSLVNVLFRQLCTTTRASASIRWASSASCPRVRAASTS